MAYVIRNCPTCGATVEISREMEYGFCEFCATRVAKDTEYIELPGEVSAESTMTAESLLERAFIFLEESDFEYAEDYLEQVLESEPKCAKAYIGRLMCILEISNMQSLANHDKPLTLYADFDRALRFSSGEEHELYLSYNRAILERNEKYEAEADMEAVMVKDDISTEIEALKSEEKEIQKYLEECETQYKQSSAKSVVLKILLIVSVIGTMIWTLASILGDPLILIIDVPFIIFMLFIIRLTVKSRKSTSEYNKYKERLRVIEVELYKKESVLRR